MNVPYKIRPIESWPGTRTPEGRRVRARFDSTNTATLQLLERELAMLNATDRVLQLDIAEKDLRNDGGLRAAARPASPGVVLTFKSKGGPMRFAADRFTGAWDNLRAIALGMEALRKIERYGIADDDQQYSGWRQLPTGNKPRELTREEAAGIIANHAADTIPAAQIIAREILRNDGTAYYIRQAEKRTHPDSMAVTSSASAFADVQLAKAVLLS